MWRLLFLYTLSLFASAFDDEDLTMFHHVNVMTGQLNLFFQDFYVPAASPLTLNRTYTSAGMFERKRDQDLKLKEHCNNWLIQGGWSVIPHAHLFIYQGKKHKKFRLYLQEPSGSRITYTYTHHDDSLFYFSPDLTSAQYTTHLGAIHDVRNNQICLDIKHGTATLTLPNGSILHYKGDKLKHPKANTQSVYRLTKEILPNQHHILYKYNHKDRLVEYQSFNPSETQSYARIQFHLDTTDVPYRFQATTSHMQQIDYQAFDYKQREYLHDVILTHQAPQHFDYQPAKEGLGARLVQMLLGKEIQFTVQYYPSDHKHANKIASLKAPKGAQGEMLKVAKFTYQDDFTDVIDVQGINTRYHYTDDQLYKIEYFNEKSEVERKTRLFWQDHRLHAKVACDPQGRAFFGKQFTYDSKGNVLTETLSGNLTGNGSTTFAVDTQGHLTNAESITTTYTYLPTFNVPVWIHEQDGLSYQHLYLPNTNLLTAKLTYYNNTIIQRSFCLYDKNNLLIAEILDDGTTSSSNDLTGVTQRTLRRYVLHPKHGLPIEISDLYLDQGEERLLKRQVLTYSNKRQVTSVAIYDSDNNYCYTLNSTYDTQGNLIAETTPLGHINTFEYDALHRLISSKEVGSPQKKITYAPNGSPLSCTEFDEEGEIQIATTLFDSKGRLLSHIDPHNNNTSHTYDAFGRRLTTQLPVDDAIIHYSYNTLGNLTATTNPLGATTHTTYTTYDKPSQITYPDGTITTHRYDKKGRLVKTIDADGTYTTYAYDYFNRPLQKHLYDASGTLIVNESWTYNTFHLLSHTNYRGATTTYTYDGAGRKISEKTGDLITHYAYDTLGALICTRTSDTATHSTYDIEGRLISTWQEQGSHIENRTDFFYDNENRKCRAERHTSVGIATDTFTYDRLNRLASHTDPESNTTQFIHQPLKHETIDPLGNRTIETYDALNRKIRTEKQDPIGNTTFIEERQYDQASQLKRQISYPMTRDPHSIEWEYDPMGRPILLTESSSKQTHYTYHSNGKIATKTLPSGIILSFDYDPLLRLRHCSSSDGQINYSYNYTLNHLELDLIDHTTGISLHQTFDTHGQLIHEIDHTGKELSWHYDSEGRRIHFQLPDHSSIQYHHQGCHLIRLDRLDPSGCVIYHHDYISFDPTGRLTESSLPADLGNITFTYDICERPQSIHSPWAHITISYDVASRLIRQENSLLTDKDYAYDPLHQLIQEGSRSYSFDALGNPTDATIGSANQLQSTPEYNLHYDQDGQPLSKSSTDTHLEFTFDPLGRLTSITDATSKTVYRYDPLSRLYDKTLYTQEGISTYTYLYDQELEIGKLHQGEITQLKLIGTGVAPNLGATVAIEINHIPFVPIHDLQGNPIALLNFQGVIIETYDLSAFGEEPPLDYINPWRFQSKRVERGFVFFGQRFYDPTLHRWLSPDPADFTDTVNLYLFVRNNPQNRLDLFGLDSLERLDHELRMDVPTHSFFSPMLIQCSGFCAWGDSFNYLDPDGLFFSSICQMAQSTWLSVKSAVVTTWNSPQFQGSMQALGGFAEAGAGAALSATPFAPLGAVMLVHGADRFSSSVYSIITGNPMRTGTSQLLQTFGMSEETAIRWDDNANFLGTLGAAGWAYKQTRGVGTVQLPRYSAPSIGQANEQILFGQKSVSSCFSKRGIFNSKPLSEVVQGLKNGSISPESIPIEIVVRNGQKISLNNRSLLTLKRAGMHPRVIIDRTGILEYENLLNKHLQGHLPSNVIQIRGGPPGTSLIGLP